jgi:P4 family phage/plasmid primase-like protien
MPASLFWTPLFNSDVPSCGGIGYKRRSKMGQILDALNTVLASDQIVELRAFSRRAGAYSKIFAPDDRVTMEVEAERCAGFQGVYFTLNPLSARLLASGESADDKDVIRRRLILIDVDPERPAGVSATNEEKGRAKVEVEAVQAHLTTLGFPLPIVADSGNGYHLLYRIDLPTDDGGLVHRCLVALKAKFPWVDTTVANPSRICKLYGTWARKGDNKPDRPHRQSAILSIPPSWDVVSEEKLRKLGATVPPTGEPAPGSAYDGPRREDQDTVERGRAYLKAAGPAIEGKGGDQKTYRLAAYLVHDLALTPEAALSLLTEWNKTCEPPWGANELATKLANAQRYGNHEDGAALAGRSLDGQIFDPVTFEPLAPSDSDKYTNAYWHVTGPRYTGPSGKDKQEHEKIARIIVLNYGFDAKGPEAMALMQAYNKTHGEVKDVQQYLDAADAKGGIRGRMWPRKMFDDPRRLAMDLVSDRFWSPKPDDCSTLRFYQDDWYVWDGTKYVKEDKIQGIVTNAVQDYFDTHQLKWRRIEALPLPEVDLAPLDRLDGVLAQPGAIFTDPALMAALAQVRKKEPTRYAGLRQKIKDVERIGDVEAALPKPPHRAKRPDAEAVTPGKVAAVMQQLEGLPECQVEESDEPLIALTNGLLDLRTREMRPHTAKFFSTLCLPFPYDPSAKCPRWLSFLESLWGNDKQSVATLQDWFGLVLLRDTSLQKMLLLVGPKRSGKGTIARTLTALLGKENVGSPTMSQMAGNFGIAALVGKSLGIIPDARLDGRTSQAVIERLLSISGEDRLDIDRKYRDVLSSVRLRTLLMVLSNEIPRFPDESGALASRFIVLQSTESFSGREDTGLEEALGKELPGIFNWALVGMERVAETGKLVQPESALGAVRDLHSAGSPVETFARDIGLVAGDQLRIGIDELFAKYAAWCGQNEIRYVGSKISFGRNIRTVFPKIKEGKLAKGGARCYVGIGIPEVAAAMAG